MLRIPVSISGILEHELTADEKVMLENFSGINSLIIDLEALVLYRLCLMLPNGKRVLEIGSYRGGSTVALGHAARMSNHKIFCIDMWSDYDQQSDFINVDKLQLNDMGILSEFMDNTAFVKDRLCMMRGNATDFSEILGHNRFSLIFIDGAHDYFSVVDDILCGLKTIEPGGILCGHDYHSAGVDVKKAVHDTIMQSETVAVKGLIENTSIWYAVIDDPEYEFLLVRTIKQMALGDFEGAHALLMENVGTIKQTAEVARLLKGLEDRNRKSQRFDDGSCI